jgi:mannan endo-1,4-beta-mannosidase
MKPAVVCLIALMAVKTFTAEPPYRLPCTPGATPEAKAVLKYLYEIQGKKILSGQMGEKWRIDYTFNKIKERSGGHYPAVYGIDLLFGRHRRENCVEAAIKYWEMGCLITWSWHAVQPGHAEDDQTGWNVMHDGKEPELVKKILTEGSPEHKEWIDRIDYNAELIKQLQDANVPLIWRPFHELNYGWFWWGGMLEVKDLYRQMYDRYVNHHGLKNIIWNWNVNYEFKKSTYSMDELYPGDDVVDMASMDIYIEYQHRWSKKQMDKLISVCNNRPVAIGENGQCPPPGTLQSEGQKWVYWMTWNGFEGKTSNYSEIYDHPFVLSQGEVDVPEWDPAWDGVTGAITVLPGKAFTAQKASGVPKFQSILSVKSCPAAVNGKTPVFSLLGRYCAEHPALHHGVFISR